MHWTLLGIALTAGILNTVQAGCNATLKAALARPVWAVVVVTAVGFAVAVLIALTSGEKLPARTSYAVAPWWAWSGGALGTFYVLAMLLTADKLGAATFVGVTVTMAILTSLVMDHFGLLGFEVHRTGVARAAGAMLMLAGLALIARY